MCHLLLVFLFSVAGFVKGPCACVPQKFHLFAATVASLSPLVDMFGILRCALDAALKVCGCHIVVATFHAPSTAPSLVLDGCRT